jgi:hypothetical protein
MKQDRLPASDLRPKSQKRQAQRVVTLPERVAEEGYSVEFLDMTGNTVGVATLPATALRMPTPADRPAARALSA